MSDYIKREDAKRVLNKGLRYMRAFGVNRCLPMIYEVPSADVRENVRATLRADHGEYRCTNCNALISAEIDYVLEDYKPIQFCPNCGAQMERR